MNRTYYRGRLRSGPPVEVEVSGSTIASVRSLEPRELEMPPGEKAVLGSGRAWFLPVLVDLQHNGALGSYYGEITGAHPERLGAIAAHLRRNGVGRCLLTLVTQDRAALDRTAAFLGRMLDEDAALARLFFGIFHEGIFISPRDGWRGAHSPRWIEPPDWERLKVVDDLTGGRIAVVNVAPEEPGGFRFIERAVAAGKKVSLGHCCPSPEQIDEAIARGASMVTHFGNGVAQQIDRFANPLWHFLDREALFLGLICDGFHLPAAIVRLAFRCKGRERCLPVSDASGCSGLRFGKYQTLGGRWIEITEAGRVQMSDRSEILVGAWFQQNRSVEFLIRECGFSFFDAWEQCSEIPARAVGLKLPRIAVGEEASFVLARWEEQLVIEQSVHAGVAEVLSKETAGDRPAMGIVQERKPRFPESAGAQV